MKNKAYLTLLAAGAVVAMCGTNVAAAADLGRPPPPVKAPPFVPPPFTWTGFYLGGNLGFAWAQHTVTDSIYGLTFDTGRKDLFIGGGQVGFNYQAGWFVGGVEGDFDGVANNGSTNSIGTFVPAVGDPIAVTSKHGWIATLAARLGVAANNWLSTVRSGRLGRQPFHCRRCYNRRLHQYRQQHSERLVGGRRRRVGDHEQLDHQTRV
jgi:outer membrane immunogenic protein